MEGREGRLTFPFTAIVGQEKAKLALLCVAVNPLIGGVLLRGDKGTGKTTLVRALANVLPEIEVVADCPFNCNPRNPLEMCDFCYKRYIRDGQLPITRRKMRVIDMPLSVTIDRVVGSIDVEKFMREGVKALQPGILAEANRNILYIDEVNLLDDYIADALLDAAATGWNIIEREGISFRHPARFILVGSMNPEEGDLRPQILDRFGLVVDVTAPMDPDVRAEIVRRVEEFHADPIGFYKKYEDKERELRERIIRARELLPKVEIDDDLLRLLAETVVKLGIKTSRAEIVTVRTAKAIAALDGRTKVTLEDLKKAMELSLPHRLRERPFEKRQGELPIELPPLSGKGEEGKGEFFRVDEALGEGVSSGKGGEGKAWGGGGEGKFEPINVDLGPPKPIELDVGLKALVKSSRDHRVTVFNTPRGIPIDHMPPKGEVRDIDLYATVKNAILRGERPPIRVRQCDIRIRVRRSRPPSLWVLILDSSGSMGVLKRISIAKGILIRLIEEGYVKRARIALIAFRGREAEVLIPPTRNYWKAIEAIESIPTGGRTPLSAALNALINIAKLELSRDPSTRVRAFLVTDGRANVPLYGDLKSELKALANMIRRLGIELVIYDTSPKGVLPGVSYIPLIASEANAHVVRV